MFLVNNGLEFFGCNRCVIFKVFLVFFLGILIVWMYRYGKLDFGKFFN